MTVLQIHSYKCHNNIDISCDVCMERNYTDECLTCLLSMLVLLSAESSLVFPASVINGVAVSKTFQIIYRGEDVTLNDIVLFKVPMLVDSLKVQTRDQSRCTVRTYPREPLNLKVTSKNT